MSGSLLVELFTEELPPKALKQLGEAFATSIAASLAGHGLVPAAGDLCCFATPRRLAVRLENVLAAAPVRSESKKLMPVKVAFDAAGQPTPALLKRLEKEGATADQLSRGTDGNAEYAFLKRMLPGVRLLDGLQAAIEEAMARLPIPKVMSYQLADGATTVSFVRPAHGLVALHGADVVPVRALGLKAGRITHGHRFQGAKDISLRNAGAYEETLHSEGGVIADFARRRADIERQLREQAARTGASLGPEADIAPLLDEVTALVEMPTVYIGQFEPEYLAVPQECLILTMRANQKYFPLFDAAGKLTNRFLIVSNMRLPPDSPGANNIIEGNQRVVRPRLADARFFFETDKKTRLEERLPQLASVTYHNKLGSQGERVKRVRDLAGSIAQAMGADATLAKRAAFLAKADLVTNMVGEFPEMQGTMGRYYALADGEDPRIADAIEQHYWPRFAGDGLPRGEIATALALADKLETLAGLFGIGQQPTGDKDPFALRRHALGVVRILVENKLALAIDRLVDAAFAAFPAGKVADAHTDLQAFILERLRGFLRDAGYTSNEIESVLCMNPVRLDQVPLQLAAVRAFAKLPEAESLAAANKRVANILKQAEAKGEAYGKAEPAAMQDAAERRLYEALKQASSRAAPLLRADDYTGYLQSYAVLKSPVDEFFDSVMVMAEDASLRRNRLALLRELRDEMNQVADIAKLSA
jgi:glycyl-tRNA synthetase beta chain